MICRSLTVLALGLTALPINAQQVSSLTPLHAVAGKETQFTVVGSGFPHRAPDSAGLKVSTLPANACGDAKRHKPLTPTHYYITCTFRRDHIGHVTLRIMNKPTKKSEKAGVVWQGSIQVLNDHPSLSEIKFVGPNRAGYERLACDSANSCLRHQGILSSQSPFEMHLLGENLPNSLHIEGISCTKSAAAASGLDKQFFTCRATTSGDVSFRVLTSTHAPGEAPLREGKIHLQ